MEGGSALEFELQLQAKLPGQPWATLWACCALFTDDAARAERLQVLATQQKRLAARQAELQDRLDERTAVRTAPMLLTGRPNNPGIPLVSALTSAATAEA